MKKILVPFVMLAAFAILLASCKKDYSGDKAVLNTTTAGVGLAISNTALVLDSTKNSTTATTFTWPTVNVGYDAVITYTLQFDLPSDSFKAPISVVVGTNLLTKVYTVKDFNVLAYQSLGLAANVVGNILVRLKADVNINGTVNTGSASSVPSMYSNAITMTVTPYKINVVYPVVYMPGDYQGWTPATAPTLASVKNDGNYEGYINVPTGNSFEFKINPAATWDASYGTNDPITSANGMVTGDMDLNGKNNLSVKLIGAGYYRFDASTTGKTWSADKTTWAVIGTATPNGAGTDTPMAFNTTTNTWSITLNLASTGTFKFRANGDGVTTNHNFGLNAGGNMIYNGTPIPVAATGNYTVTLDLSTPGSYTYTMKKN